MRDKITTIIIEHINRSAVDAADKILALFPQWVSVKDRLPEEEGRYPILWPNGSVSDAPKEYIHKCRGSLPILWLNVPLPQPPKEQQ